MRIGSAGLWCFVLCCCAPRTTPECACPEQVVDTPQKCLEEQIDRDPVPAPVDPEPTSAPTPQHLLQYNDLELDVEVHEEEELGRVRVFGQTDGQAIDLEFPIELGGCLTENLESKLEVLFSEEVVVAVEVQIRCHFGSTVQHLVVDHAVVAIDVETAAAGILFAGQTDIIDNRGVAVVGKRLEFYIEAGLLAVYEHQVAWCDRRALRELMGQRVGCRQHPRRLKLVKRVPVVAPEPGLAE